MTLAKVHIQFVGAWRLFLGTKEISIDASDIHAVRDYIETHYRPVFARKLQSMGVKKKESVWENSNILINGKTVSDFPQMVFKDGDRVDLIPLIAGG